MNTSFFLICVCALLLMAVGMIFAKPILLLFGSSENGLIYAYPYLMIYLIGTFPSMVSTGMNPFINAQGYATTGMFSVAIGAIANLILDPVLSLCSDSVSAVRRSLRCYHRFFPQRLSCIFCGKRPN